MGPPTDSAGARPRILFLFDPELGHVTAHLRGFLFEEPLRQRGWDVRFLSTRTTGVDALVAAARDSDIVYLLKVSWLTLVERIRAEVPTTRIVFDLTDALWQPIHRQCGWKNLEKILALAHAIFSENEAICAFGRHHCKRVFSIPACTRGEAFDAARLENPPPSHAGIRLGWMGSVGTLGAIAGIADQIDRIGQRYSEVELRLLGCPDSAAVPAMPHVRVSCVPTYDEAAMIAEVLAFDIGLFPAPGDLEDYAVRGALKALLYMTAGVPPVALRAGDCARVIEDGVTGMLVDADQSWEVAIGRLMRDATLRDAVGKRAKVTIERTHSLDAVTGVLDDALRNVHEFVA